MNKGYRGVRIMDKTCLMQGYFWRNFAHLGVVSLCMAKKQWVTVRWGKLDRMSGRFLPSPLFLWCFFNSVVLVAIVFFRLVFGSPPRVALWHADWQIEPEQVRACASGARPQHAQHQKQTWQLFREEGGGGQPARCVQISWVARKITGLICIVLNCFPERLCV